MAVSGWENHLFWWEILALGPKVPNAKLKDAAGKPNAFRIFPHIQWMLSSSGRDLSWTNQHKGVQDEVEWEFWDDRNRFHNISHRSDFVVNEGVNQKKRLWRTILQMQPI